MTFFRIAHTQGTFRKLTLEVLNLFQFKEKGGCGAAAEPRILTGSCVGVCEVVGLWWVVGVGRRTRAFRSRQAS